MQELKTTDRNRVEECLVKTGLWEQFCGQPTGIDTPMTKEITGGIVLSGGQQQKLLMARALYKDAPILILDEPTAALDPIAESRTYEQFHEIASDKTAVYISHRLASTRFCDKIAFFKQWGKSQRKAHTTNSCKREALTARCLHCRASTIKTRRWRRLMLKHNKLKPVGIAIRLMWNMDKWLLIHSIITSVIEAATPFAGILLSAYILDGLQAGEEFTEIISVSLAAVAVIFLLTVLKAYFSKILNVHIGMCGKRYDTLMSMKTISMDYPLLDSPAVNDIRVRIRHDNDWGAGFYSLVWQLPYLLNSLISTFVSVVLMLPLFMEGHFFSDTPAILLLLSLGAIIAFNLWFTSVKNKELYRLLDDPSLDKSYLGYFLWNDQDYHYGKDIRIYDAKTPD